MFNIINFLRVFVTMEAKSSQQGADKALKVMAWGVVILLAGISAGVILFGLGSLISALATAGFFQ